MRMGGDGTYGRRSVMVMGCLIVDRYCPGDLVVDN